MSGNAVAARFFIVILATTWNQTRQFPWWVSTKNRNRTGCDQEGTETGPRQIKLGSETSRGKYMSRQVNF